MNMVSVVKASATAALMVGLALLSGCAANGGTQSWSAAMGNIEAGWPLAEAAITAATPAADQARVTAMESKVSADLAALSQSAAPVSMAALETDVALVMAVLPPGPKATEIGVFVALIEFAANMATGVPAAPAVVGAIDPLCLPLGCSVHRG